MNLSGAYLLKTFLDENIWYRDYWIEDTSSGKWYYWSDKEGDWVESSPSAPGEKQSVLRKDNRIKAKLSLNYGLNENTTLRIFYRYTLNNSTMDDIANFNYNWSKGEFGGGLSYGF